VANGLVDNTLEQRIHYSGAMNGGMSGGPALDSTGAVYGVNVSVFSGKQSVSFVVPAKHIGPLLTRALKPLDTATVREQVAAQLQAHQAALFASIISPLTTQTTLGYALPTTIAPSIECNSDGNNDPNTPLRIETISCAARVSVFVQRGLDVGDIRFQHRVLETQLLQPLQFSSKLNALAESAMWAGADKHVAPFACSNDIVALNGFDARISTCVRQYRMFAGLYDIAVTVVSVNQAQRAIVSSASLRGVGFESGMGFVRHYLGAMQWNP
jgi:serine protease Do